MKKKPLLLILKMTKYTLYVFLFQMILFNVVLAHRIEAQKIDQVYVNVSFDQEQLIKVLREVEAQSEFQFTIHKNKSYLKEKVTVHHAHISVEDLLKDIGRQTGLSFQQVNRNISIRQRAKDGAVESDSKEILIDIDVTGIVTDEKDEPIPGVTVSLPGTSIGTVTDIDGEYVLSVPEGSTLVFSFIGFVSQRIAVGNQNVINITLIEDTSSLDEVVVIGYGVQKKSDLTGSVGSMRSEEIAKQPVISVDQALQGRISGVQVSNTSGAPGSAASIRIRGGNSINAGNEPLFVIDGFIGGGDLNSININDIQSVEVLKDASATAIYGSRGSNGVILISTKRGSGIEGFGVSLDSYVGIQSPVRKIDILNGSEFADYRNEFATFLGSTEPFPNANEISNTDWQDVLFRNVPMTSHTLNFNNNTQNSNYYVSLNYLGQDGIQLGSSYDRYQMRFNFDQGLGTVLNVGASFNASYSNRENPRASALGNFVLPTAPIYNDDGSYHRIDAINGSTYNNPIAQDEQISDNTYRNRALGNIYLQVSPIDGLIVKSTFGFDINTTKQNRYNAVNLPTNFEAARGGQAFINSDFSNSIQNENTVNYIKEIDNHSFNLLGGWTYQEYSLENLNAASYGFTNDVTTFNAIETGDPELLRASSGETNWSLLSGLYRLNYSYRGKYLLTASGRHDGSSRLSEGNKWQFFPSAAIAWRMSEEEFIQNMDVFSSLKLRASYGKTGSESIDPYSTLARLNSGKNLIGGQQVVTFFPAESADPSLKWEVSSQYDFGLEAGILDGKLQFEFDYYYKKTTDLLLSRELPFQTGFASRLENVGSLQNQGVEVTILARIINKNDFSWSSDLTVSSNKNELLKLYGDSEFIENGIGSRLIVGESVNSFFGAKFIGLWQEGDEGLGGNNVPGAPRFEDLDGDGLITISDGQIIGKGIPDFYGGLNNIFAYKRFTLSAFFDFSYGNDIFDLSGRTFNTGFASNVYGKFRDRWTPTNTNTDVPRAGSQLNTYFNAYPGEGGSSIDVHDGSYLRLKNINLQYQIPVNMRIFRNLTAYSTATNLFTLTRYDGFSPDENATGTHPTRRGYGSNGYPPAKMFLIGIKAGF